MIKHFPVIPYSKEFFEARSNSLGGSDMGPALRKSQWVSVFIIWEHKAGIQDHGDIINENMHWGKLHEKNVVNQWMFYDGNKDDRTGQPNYVVRHDNYMKAIGKAKSEGLPEPLLSTYIYRRPLKRSIIVRNDKYPWLHYMPDALIDKNQPMLINNRQINADYGVLETKLINNWYSRQYEDGIPDEYHYQVITGMIVTGLKYAELVMLVDGSKLRVKCYNYDPVIADKLITESYDFWHNHVLPAKKVQAEIRACLGRSDFEPLEELQAKLHSFEPEPDNTKESEDYMSKMLTDSRVGKSMVGDDAMLDAAKKYAAIGETTNMLEELQQGIRNNIIQVIKANNIEEIHFGDKGWIRYKGVKNSDSLRFTVDPDIKPKKFLVATQLKGMNFLDMYEQDGD